MFPGPKRVSGAYAAHAERMAEGLRKHFSTLEAGRRCLLEVDDRRYRVQRVCPDLYAARTLRSSPLPLSALGFPPAYQNLLLSEELRRTGGLVVIFGATGAGKTTTAAATVVSRLQTLGGYCLCVEDPPENMLHGFHGERGYAEQMDASEIGYEATLVEALRCFPSQSASMMLLGEIRTKAEAFEALQTALDGHLVVTTMHAKDIVSGLSRLAALASATGEKDTRSLLAAGLALAVHQSLSNGTPRMTALRFNAGASAIVQNGALHLLQDEILKQNKTYQFSAR
jgi:Tfp pilus assembly pilus retraction ATPase PilT